MWDGMHGQGLVAAAISLVTQVYFRLDRPLLLECIVSFCLLSTICRVLILAASTQLIDQDPQAASRDAVFLEKIQRWPHMERSADVRGSASPGVSWYGWCLAVMSYQDNHAREGMLFRRECSSVPPPVPPRSNLAPFTMAGMLSGSAPQQITMPITGPEVPGQYISCEGGLGATTTAASDCAH